MSEEMLDFNNVLCLRNQLCCLDEKQLCEIYQDKGSYLSFLNAVVALTECDSAFLLFSNDFLEKILSVIQIHRFDFEEKEVKECINDIIGYVNHVMNMDPLKASILKNGYLSYQEEQRKATFRTTNALLQSLCYDGIVFASLRDGDLESIQDEDYFLMSLNYLMKACPELFQNEEVNARTTQLLDKIGSHSPRFGIKKKYIKEVREDFQKLFKEDE